MSLDFHKDILQTEHLKEIAEETAKALGEEERMLFVYLYSDCLTLRGAIDDAYSKDEPFTSLVAFDFLSFLKEISWLNRLFHWGNYVQVCRSLRFLWELIFCAYYADTFTANHPDDKDVPGPTVEEKASWLGNRENRLNWSNVIEPVLKEVLPAGSALIQDVFLPLWRSLNSTVHPSNELREKLIDESALFLFDKFDAKWATETLQQARLVFDLLWLAVLTRFPNCIALLKKLDNPEDFRVTPGTHGLIKNDS